jgi:hypothetical protein
MSDEPLLAWQWRLYRANHRDRANLAIHLVTQPLFIAGLAGLAIAPLLGIWWLLAVAPLAMIAAVALQGRGHRMEAEPPVPFRGPLDVIARLLAEQLITFPRYVLTGELARAWRGASTTRKAA